MNECRICGTKSVIKLLDFGKQPICNRFLASPADEEYLHPIVIRQCNACGLIQINNPVPSAELLPHYDWISYTEPEVHLDQLVEIISNLPGLTKESIICGISFKDDSTLARLKKQGFKNTWRINPESDLGICDYRAGVETIQDYLTPGAADMIVDKYGKSDVVIVRHILEHTHDTSRFTRAIKQLVNPKGYIVLEVPDCTRAFENYDYTALWEEHLLYFTPQTFRRYFAFGGFSLLRLECYPYPFENSLVAIAQLQENITPSFPSEGILEIEKHRAQAYFQGLPKVRTRLKRLLWEYQQNQGKIALFGAGHLACAFINLLCLKDNIEFVVDDNSNKQGLFMPGSRLPIRPSGALVKDNIKLCLLSLSLQSEDKVIQNNGSFREHRGTFLSIFPASKYALYKFEQLSKVENHAHKTI